MGWRILYIEEANVVRLYLDNIKIERDVGELTVPLSDVHTLVIDNQTINITTPLIVKCSEYNINLIICSREHMPVAMISPFSGNYKSPLMLKKQINWDIFLKQELHMKIVKNKIENQCDLLKHLDKSQDVIRKMIDYSFEVHLSDETNREGLASKIYFRELFGEKFRRFDEDVLNAGLNYGYSILRSQISKVLVAKGLNTSLGIFHKGYDNPFNLSDDIIEVFRPLIDEYVYNNLMESIILKKVDRLGLIEVTTKDAIINMKRHTIFNVIEIYIEKIISCFEKNDSSDFESVRLIYGL